MKVKLHTTYASPSRTAQPGEVIDVPDGVDLVKAGYAVPAEVAVETAEAPAPETTATRTGKRKQRKGQ